jgi:hypothetical protein
MLACHSKLTNVCLALIQHMSINAINHANPNGQTALLLAYENNLIDVCLSMLHKTTDETITSVIKIYPNFKQFIIDDFKITI